MINRRNFLQIITASVPSSLLMLSGCQNPFTNATTPEDDPPNFQENGTIRLAFTTPPNTFDPAVASSTTEYSVSSLTHNGLVWVDKNLKPRPALAKTWEATEDLSEWIFILRKDAFFHHDSVPMTAVDVVYSIKRLLDPKIGSPLRSALTFIKDIDELDDYTVRFVLKTPYSDLPLLLGAPQASIVSKVYEADFLSQEPSGTGPFKFSEYNQGESLILKHNPNYWGQNSSPPPIQTIEHHYISSLAEQVTALVNDDIDVISTTSFSQADSLTDNPDIKVKEITSGAYNTIVMRATEPPFDDPLVRKALKYCLDRPALLEIILHGHGEMGNDHPVSSSSPYWNDLPKRSYDPEKAQALLTEAGYPDGLTLDLITSEASPGMIELAEQFKKMAAPAGVKIIVTRVSADIYWSDYWNQHPPFFIGSWGFRSSIDETFMIAYHSQSKWNEARWHTPEQDELLDAARAEPDHDKRVELYQEAQKMLYEEGAVIIPYFRPILMSMNKRVHGLDPHPAGWIDLTNVRLLAEDE